jgi:hypothetical protein
MLFNYSMTGLDTPVNEIPISYLYEVIEVANQMIS